MSVGTNGGIGLIKADPSGNKEWKKTFVLGHGNSVRQTSDGGYIVAGFNGYWASDQANVLLIKTDSSGNEKWNKTFGKGAAKSVQQTDDGGYIITGNTNNGGTGQGVPMSKGHALLIKTDANEN